MRGFKQEYQSMFRKKTRLRRFSRMNLKGYFASFLLLGIKGVPYFLVALLACRTRKPQQGVVMSASDHAVQI